MGISSLSIAHVKVHMQTVLGFARQKQEHLQILQAPLKNLNKNLCNTEADFLKEKGVICFPFIPKELCLSGI